MGFSYITKGSYGLLCVILYGPISNVAVDGSFCPHRGFKKTARGFIQVTLRFGQGHQEAPLGLLGRLHGPLKGLYGPLLFHTSQRQFIWVTQWFIRASGGFI